MGRIKVLVVDDQYISRRLFEMYISASDRYELVESVSSASYAYAYILSQKIDLVIMDILMNDGSSGLEAAERIKKKDSNIKIILVTSMPECSWMEKAKKIGVESFWYKEASKESITDIMDLTMNGISVYPDNPPQAKIGITETSEFTDKELEVLRILTTGASNAKIGERLYMTEGTVKQYINRILIKTGCHSRTELAVKARVSGVVIDMDSEQKT